MSAGPRLTLLTRAGCGLCEELLAELEALRAGQPAIPAVALVDVDADPALQRRWGLKIPVLLLDGAPVCSGRLDTPELLRLLRL
ncbi:MAG: glutaredoxin family protein [Gammaproteobacteria bacterium]|nr:glutaredoxin family protein [Gammaproteobacteria bacterium]